MTILVIVVGLARSILVHERKIIKSNVLFFLGFTGGMKDWTLRVAGNANSVSAVGREAIGSRVVLEMLC